MTTTNERTEGWAIEDPYGPAHYWVNGVTVCERDAFDREHSEYHDAGVWPVTHCAECVTFLNELQQAIMQRGALNANASPS